MLCSARIATFRVRHVRVGRDGRSGRACTSSSPGAAGRRLTGTPRLRSTSPTRQRARPSRPWRWPAPATSTPRWPPPAQAFPDWSARHPGRAVRRCSPGWPRCSTDRADELASTESRQTGKPIRLSTGFDVPGTVDNVAFFAGRRAQPRGQGRRGVLRRPHLVRPARGHRRRRLDRAVELPAADGRLEDPAGDRRGQHDRAQAGRDHAADRRCMLAEAATEAGHPRRRGQRRDRRRAGGGRGA